MCMDNQLYDKDFKELEPSEELVSCDLKSGEVKNYGEVVKGTAAAVGYTDFGTEKLFSVPQSQKKTFHTWKRLKSLPRKIIFPKTKR